MLSPLRRRRVALLPRRGRPGEPGHRLHLVGVRAPQQRRAGRRLGQPGQPHHLDDGQEPRLHPGAGRADRRRPRPCWRPRRRAFATVGDLLARSRQKAAIGEAMSVVGAANKYLSDMAPWKLKNEDPARMAAVLHVALQVVDDAKTLLTPFLPSSSSKVHALLGGAGTWAAMPELVDGERQRRRLARTTACSPATTTAGRRAGSRRRSRSGARSRRRRRCSPSSTRRSSTRSWPASSGDAGRASQPAVDHRSASAGLRRAHPPGRDGRAGRGRGRRRRSSPASMARGARRRA